MTGPREGVREVVQAPYGAVVPSPRPPRPRARRLAWAAAGAALLALCVSMFLGLQSAGPDVTGLLGTGALLAVRGVALVVGYAGLWCLARAARPA